MLVGLALGVTGPVQAWILPKEPLHAAVLENSLKNVQDLIDQGVDVNKVDDRYDCTALHMAAMHGHLEIAKALRKAGAKIYVETAKKEPLMFAAVSSGNIDLIKFLLAEGASSKSRNADGENLIHHAITCRHRDVVQFLIATKVDVKATDKKGYTPLHTAAWIGDLPVTKDLVAAGATVDATTNHKETPLHVAASYDHAQIVEDLLAAKADCNRLDDSGRTPLFLTKSVTLMDLLLKAGAKPNISDRDQYSPLSGAVVAEDAMALAARLIKGGADVNQRIDHGRTAIFDVIPNDKVEIFALLVEHGANLNLKSDSGETPLDWVRHYKARKIQAFLEGKDKRR